MERSSKKRKKDQFKPSLSLLIDFCNIKTWDVNTLLELYQKHRIGILLADLDEQDGFDFEGWLICRTALDEEHYYLLTDDPDLRGMISQDDDFVLPSEPRFISLWGMLKKSQKPYIEFLENCVSKKDLDISFIKRAISVFASEQWFITRNTSRKWDPFVYHGHHIDYAEGSLSPSLFPSYIETYIDLEIAMVIVREQGGEVFPYIKKCKFCEHYYLPKVLRLDQKYCSERCKRKDKWTPEKWNEYMLRYRKHKKEEKIQTSRKQAIKEMMRRSGCSREEAIEMIDADEKL